MYTYDTKTIIFMAVSPLLRAPLVWCLFRTYVFGSSAVANGERMERNSESLYHKLNNYKRNDCYIINVRDATSLTFKFSGLPTESAQSFLSTDRDIYGTPQKITSNLRFVR